MSRADTERRYREKHRESPEHRRRRAAHQERYRARNPVSPEKARAYRLRTKWGMTLAQYAALLSSQDGVCALCLRPPKNRPLHVDHDHKTGMIRGLLCHRCNRGLGYIYAAHVLERAAAYVRRDTGLYMPKHKKRPHRVKRQEWKERPSRNRKATLPVQPAASQLALAELVPAR